MVEEFTTRSLVTLLETSKAMVTRKTHSHPAAYALVSESSGKAYVGSTEDLYTRVNKHRTDLEAGRHKNPNLQAEFNAGSRFDLAYTKTETKEEALEIEQKLLNDFIPTGLLLNRAVDVKATNQGGVLITDESKQKHRQATLDQFADEEVRRKHSEISKKLWEDPEYRAKQAAREFTEEQRKRMSETTSEKWKDPEYREKILKSKNDSGVMKSSWENDDRRAQQSERSKKLWEDPEYRAKMLVKSTNSVALKDKWQDPEYRSEMVNKLNSASKALWQDPVRREKMIEAQRQGRLRKAQHLATTISFKENQNGTPTE